MDWLDRASAAHQRLIKRVHGFRMPLGPKGQVFMQCVYFSIPVVGGYYVMQAAIGQSHEKYGQDGRVIREWAERGDAVPAASAAAAGASAAAAAVAAAAASEAGTAVPRATGAVAPRSALADALREAAGRR